MAPTNTFLTENHERTADLDKVESEPQSSEITNQETFEPNFNQNLMEDEKCVNDAIKSAVVGKMDQKEIVSDENETESFLQPSADMHKNMVTFTSISLAYNSVVKKTNHSFSII